MLSTLHITSIKFKNYKAFSEYSVSLNRFNVLVGPNNAGKSTILGAIRILSEGLRKARRRKPEIIQGPSGTFRGYAIDLRNLPISTENVFHNYDESHPALITFRLSNKNELVLYFPEKGSCYLFPKGERSVKSPSDFKRDYDLKVSFVPVLGPVDHNELLYGEEAARLALLSQGASRNFRNIWHHFREGFPEFRSTIQQTWPGMDIKPPEMHWDGEHQVLRMFCPEDRLDREIFWAGFGFQVWCQMLTFMLQAKDSSLLIIDEPDIYLHSDLQRQLVTILTELGPDIIIATHSTEIISEVESIALLNVNKRFRSARRVQNSRELQDVFSVLGSNLNPTLTQLAKTKRVVFVEGKDFQIISRFARKLGSEVVANRAHFAVVPVEGFNPQKVKDFSHGMEQTLGSELLKAVIFDRDFRCEEESKDITADLSRFCSFAVVHNRKEIENYLLEPSAVAQAIARRLGERNLPLPPELLPNNIPALLMSLTDPLKNDVQSQMVASRQLFERKAHSGLHGSNSSKAAMDEFDMAWGIFEARMRIVPGKKVLSILNGHLQSVHQCAVTPAAIIESSKRENIFQEVKDLVGELEQFSRSSAAGSEE